MHQGLAAALLLAVVVAAAASAAGTAHAHTVDAVGPYRVEIGWMNEPVVSGDTNAIEIYVSPLEPGLDLEDQAFGDGIPGLADTVRLDLLYKDQRIALRLAPDHNMPGKYYAFVNPTVAGFYQANVFGTIRDTPISLSMHPPKVGERSYLEFPEPSDLVLTQITGEHTGLTEQIRGLETAVAQLEEAQARMGWVSTAGIVASLAIALLALTLGWRSLKSKNSNPVQ